MNELCDGDAALAILLYAAVLPYPDVGRDTKVRAGTRERARAAPLFRLLLMLCFSARMRGQRTKGESQSREW